MTINLIFLKWPLRVASGLNDTVEIPKVFCKSLHAGIKVGSITVQFFVVTLS